MGPKLVIFCALAAIAKGGVMEKIKPSEAPQYYNENHQAKINSTFRAPPSVVRSDAGEASVLSAMLPPAGENAMKPVKEFDSVKTNVTRNIKAPSVEGAASFPSPASSKLPAYRRVVEKLSYPTRKAEAAKHEDVDGLEMEGRCKARLNESLSLLPEKTYDDGQGGEGGERLGNPSRSVRDVGEHYRINFPAVCPYKQILSACCPTTPAPHPPSPPVCPIKCCLPSCPPAYPPIYPPHYAKPATDDSFPFIKNEKPEVYYSSYSGTRAEGDNVNGDTIIKINSPDVNAKVLETSDKHQPTRIFAEHERQPKVYYEDRSRSKNILSPTNTGSSKLGCIYNQNACVASHSGNGDGGNKMKSCINYVKGGCLCRDCGGGRGGNSIHCFCNVVEGDGACLTDKCEDLKSLINLVIGKNCSLYGCNCRCYDEESSEEGDSRRCHPKKPCPRPEYPCHPSKPTDNCPPCNETYENKKKLFH